MRLFLAKVFEKLFVRPKGDLPEIVFSEKDHFPHKQFSVEWWYFTGFLSEKPAWKNSAAGKGEVAGELQYAFEITFFRAKRPFESRMLHVALYKLNAGTADENEKFIYGESVSPCVFKRRYPENNTVVCVKDSYLVFDKNKNAFVCNVQIPVKTNARNNIVKKLRLQLELSLHNLMLQGKKGVINMADGKGGASYYITYPDISFKGIIEEETDALEVYGTAWHDHQFGNFTVFDSAWDWFSLRFDEQKLYIMVFGFRKIKQKVHGVKPPNANEEYITSGNVFKNGKSILLEDVRITPEEFFTLSSGAKYPLVWRISIFKGGTEVMRFRTEPLIKDCEFRSQFAPHYWEGPCKVSGEVLLPFEQAGVHFAKDRLQGLAFVELVGYAR